LRSPAQDKDPENEIFRVRQRLRTARFAACGWQQPALAQRYTGSSDARCVDGSLFRKQIRLPSVHQKEEVLQRNSRRFVKVRKEETGDYQNGTPGRR
jgi:hypothetical protein